METMRAQDIRYLIIHCSATKSNTNYSVYQLEREHQRRGFYTAGYHYYIRRSGEIHPLREHDEVGAHCRGYNRQSLGICYEGGLDTRGGYADTRTWEQKESLRRLLWMLHRLYPNAKIVGHRDLSKDRNQDGLITPDEWEKACPCFDARAEYDYIEKGLIRKDEIHYPDSINSQDKGDEYAEQ